MTIQDKMTYRMQLSAEDRKEARGCTNWYPDYERAKAFCEKYGLQLPPADADGYCICFHEDADPEKTRGANPAYFAVSSNADREWSSLRENQYGEWERDLVVRITKDDWV